MVHEADARRALERARFDVSLGDVEAGEPVSVLLLGGAGIADASALTSKRDDGQRDDSNEAGEAGPKK
jgi:hypothetical protein